MKLNLKNLIGTPCLAGLVIALTGCSAGMGGVKWYLADKQSTLVARGNPPAYVEGYLDGCSSGRRMAGDRRFSYRQDAARAEREALYARGWQEGNIACKNEALTDEYERQCEQQKGMQSPLDAERHRRVEAESRAAEAEMKEIWEELKK